MLPVGDRESLNAGGYSGIDFKDIADITAVQRNLIGVGIDGDRTRSTQHERALCQLDRFALEARIEHDGIGQSGGRISVGKINGVAQREIIVHHGI